MFLFSYKEGVFDLIEIIRKFYVNRLTYETG